MCAPAIDPDVVPEVDPAAGVRRVPAVAVGGNVARGHDHAATRQLSSVPSRPGLENTYGEEFAIRLAFITAASSIFSVSFPVNVFCWLGWNEPTRTYGPMTTVAS